MSNRLAQSAMTILMVLPIVAVGLLSLSGSSGVDFYQRPSAASTRWWINLLQEPSWQLSAVTSVTIGFICAITSLLIVLPPVALSRLHRLPLIKTMLMLSGLPLFLPPVVMAVALYAPFQELGLFDTAIGLAISHLILAVPICAYTLHERLRVAGTAQYEVARALGASSPHATITWLVAEHRLSILLASMAAFMASLTEATLTVFLTDVQIPTIAKQALSGLSQNFDPSGYAAMTLWIAIAGIVAIMSRRSAEKHG